MDEPSYPYSWLAGASGGEPPSWAGLALSIAEQLALLQATTQ